MRKIVYFISFYGFMILAVDHSVDADIFNEVKLRITSTNNEPTIVHLKEVKSFLANGNLPMWIVQNNRLIQMNSKIVMQEVGPFTMYQESDTSSAAVYFHKRHEFDGTIDIRYIIKGLSSHQSIKEAGKETSNEYNAVFERRVWGHTDEKENEKSVIPSLVTQWIVDKKLSDGNNLKIEPYGYEKEKFYIEILLVINYDMVKQLQFEKNHGYASLVSYLLTLFNSVDMLFSKLDDMQIKVNIAGIIILPDRDALPSLAKCYTKVTVDSDVIEEISVTCAEKVVKVYLSIHKQMIPADSYDIVIFLTRYHLFEYEYDENTGKMEVDLITGMTISTSNREYESQPNFKFNTVILVTDSEHFGSFPVVSHEMVHAFGVVDHDEPRDTKNGICCEKIMKESDGFCQHCLNWSHTTKTLLRTLLRSPYGCIFKNEPRSLSAPGPRLMLTADQQCQCYGYESAQTPRKLCWDGFWCYILGYCNTHLHCMDKNGEIYNAPEPMDGTPCNNNNVADKVCWNRQCEKINNEKN